MSNDLEEEMRIALFGPSSQALVPPPARQADVPAGPAAQPKKAAGGRGFPKLRVIIRASKLFEGQTEDLVYDASTLSTLVAEQEAKAAAKKLRFKYLEVISVTPV